MLAVELKEINKSQKPSTNGKQPFAMVVRTFTGSKTPILITKEQDYLDNFTLNGLPTSRDDFEALELAGKRNFYCLRAGGSGELFGGVVIPAEGNLIEDVSMGTPSNVPVVKEAVGIGDNSTLIFSKNLDASISGHVAKALTNTVDVILTRGGTDYIIAKDNGSGVLVDQASIPDISVSGTIDYVTGAIALTFIDDVTFDAPKVGDTITTSYDDTNQESYSLTTTEEITPSTIIIKSNAVQVAIDDGLGNISGTGITGTVNYVSKLVNVIFQTPVSPDPVTIDYKDNNQVSGLNTGLQNITDYDFGKDDNGVIGSGDNTTLIFNYILPNKALPNTLKIFVDAIQVGKDDGFGDIVEVGGSGLTGTIDYNSKTVSLTFTTAPASGSDNITYTDRTPDLQAMILLTGKDPSANNNNFSIKVSSITSPISDKLFKIEIGKLIGSTVELQNSYIVSFDPTVKDGFENSLYILEVMKNDTLVSVRVNDNIDTTLMPSYSSNYVSLSGGVTWTSQSSSDVISAWNNFKKNYKKYNARLLLDISANPTIGKAVYEIAKENWFQRAVMCVPSVKITNSDSIEDISVHIQRAKDYRDVNGVKLGINSVYGHGSLFDNWYKIADTFNGGYRWLSPVGQYGKLSAFVEDNKNLWQSVAGGNWGVIDNAIELEFNFDEDTTQSLPKDNQINVLTYSPAGKIFWGDWNLTTIESNISTTGVRDIFSYIEEAITNFLFYKNYEYNDSDTRLDVYNSIDNLMSPLKTQGAFWDYSIIVDKTNNTDEVINDRKLLVTLRVEPRKGITSVLFTFEHFLKGGIKIYEA